MSKKRRKKTKNGNITTKPHELTPEQERQIAELQKIALKIEKISRRILVTSVVS